ncbi:MAG: nucleoside 2-deoxyribosyltransferase [Firmicutes bacterium]|nr:nucleoside 2-deoxyribosyltransferase [Bacillota bacterium]
MMERPGKPLEFPNNCIICKSINTTYNLEANCDKIIINCPTCGVFMVSVPLYMSGKLLENGNGYIASAIIREANELGQPMIELDDGNIEDYFSEKRLPFGIIDKLNKILLYIYRKTKFAGSSHIIRFDNDYPIAYAVNKKEFKYLISQLKEMNLIEIIQNWIDADVIETRLTIEGWKRVDEIRSKDSMSGNQCFIAMAFDESLDEMYFKGLEPGVRETGYYPLRIDRKEHNEKICDLILLEIRRSRLLIADFTFQRAGVYFEAGFALGLNIPVIWTCRKDELTKCHFDTRQYNHIEWETPEEIREKIKNRILATVPLKK